MKKDELIAQVAILERKNSTIAREMSTLQRQFASLVGYEPMNDGYGRAQQDVWSWYDIAYRIGILAGFVDEHSLKKEHRNLQRAHSKTQQQLNMINTTK